MGLAARKIDRDRARSRRPELRLVPPRPAKSASKRTASRTSPAYDLYVAFLVLLTALAVLGLGRVWLSAEAAEASIASSRLRAEIKAARFEGDMLEIQASRLATPSRIEAIAGNAMGMSQPAKVCYLNIGDPKIASGSEPSEKPATGGFKGTVASAMELAAGEAQVLLVGDVGLASSR